MHRLVHSVMDTSIVRLTIAFVDSGLAIEEKDEEAQNLLDQMRGLDEVESVSRVLDLNPPEASKALGGFLVGLLTAEVSSENIKKLMTFLGDRLGNKPIELEVEANGKKLKVKASSQAELAAAIEAAQKFVAS